MSEESYTHIAITKKRIASEQRMAAKALLLANFPAMLDAGQLIIHFGPGRNPIWVELQERRDPLARQELLRTG